MQLTVAVDVAIEVTVQSHSDSGSDGSTQRYAVTGPPRQLNMLHGACCDATNNQCGVAVQGLLSPIAPIPPDRICSRRREAMGIPLLAKYFAFAYPGEFKATSADHESEWQSIDKKLAKLNLADEMWGFFLLVGGFIFLDEERKVIAVNALTLVPSVNVMNFDGPCPASLEAINALQSRTRMAPITLEALLAAGFKAVSWVAPSEEVGGVALSESTSYPHGAFVYLMQPGYGPPTFFSLRAHTEAELEEWETQRAQRQ